LKLVALRHLLLDEAIQIMGRKELDRTGCDPSLGLLEREGRSFLGMSGGAVELVSGRRELGGGMLGVELEKGSWRL